ncbi:MAG TPA: DUF4286 family protein [Gemmatimonadales bacterium]|nr:DUF4286 family protein [Gemmatimonadales bacterium]
MIRYEVMLEVEPQLTAGLEDYMRGKHIPEILATGCFEDIRFEQAGEGRFRTSYHAATPADLERYLSRHTSGFRASLLEYFPRGVTAVRETWTELETWTR